MAAKGRMRDRGEVAADADVNWLALLQCGGDGSVNLFMCILQVVHHCLQYLRYHLQKIKI
jgi:hypothetical protein